MSYYTCAAKSNLLSSWFWYLVCLYIYICRCVCWFIYSILKVIILMVYVYERLLYTLLDIGTCFWNTIKNSTCRYCLSQFVAWLHNDCQWGNILSKELWHLQKKWWPITDSSCHMTYILLTLFKPQHSYCFCHELCNSLHNGNVVFFLLKSHFQLIILLCFTMFT